MATSRTYVGCRSYTVFSIWKAIVGDITLTFVFSNFYLICENLMKFCLYGRFKSFWVLRGIHISNEILKLLLVMLQAHSEHRVEVQQVKINLKNERFMLIRFHVFYTFIDNSMAIQTETVANGQHWAIIEWWFSVLIRYVKCLKFNYTFLLLTSKIKICVWWKRR